jgi:hypothetical protein
VQIEGHREQVALGQLEGEESGPRVGWPRRRKTAHHLTLDRPFSADLARHIEKVRAPIHAAIIACRSRTQSGSVAQQPGKRLRKRIRSIAEATETTTTAAGTRRRGRFAPPTDLRRVARSAV